MTLNSNYLSAVATLVCAAIVSAATAAGPSILSVQSDSNTVALYEKFELRIDIKAKYANPFDPGEIDLWTEFSSPSGKIYRISWQGDAQ